MICPIDILTQVFLVDSLKAVEIRNWLFRELKCDVSVFDILSPISIADLSLNIAERSEYLPAGIDRKIHA